MAQVDMTDIDTEQSSSMQDEIRQNRIDKCDELRKQGVEPYPYKYEPSHHAKELQDKYAELEDGTETEDIVKVAGRIMAMRNNGMFIDIKDTSGKVQVFCHKDSMDASRLEILKSLDIGDIVGAEGTMRRTPRGELSVRCTEVTLLTKSLLPLPEKYHGLSDVETRYRQRYLDLIMNDESRETLRTRSRVVSAIREYMDNMGALEVETSILHSIMGGATAKPFETHHNALDANFFLRVATELPLKRLIVGGFADHVYEIGRCFRNEGISIKHNPEFTSIEAYHTYMDYNDIMTLIEDMVQSVVMKIHGSTKVTFGDVEIDFSGPWRRASMNDLVTEATGVDFLTFETAEEARAAADKLKVPTPPTHNWGQVLEAVFEEKVEASLIQPTHVIDSPLDISPLAKVHRDNPRLVER